MNLLQFRTKLRKRIGNPAIGDVADADLDEHANGAYKEIADKYGFLRSRGRATFMTTIGADKYIVSSITAEITEVWDRTNKKRLDKVGSRYVATHEFEGTADETRGRPEKYARVENYLQLLPIPDGAYKIEFFYKAILADLAGDNAVPITPVQWDRGIILLATYYYYSDQAKDSPKATAAYNEWKLWLADKPIEAHEEAATIDSGVEIPTLADPADRRLDFDHSE